MVCCGLLTSYSWYSHLSQKRRLFIMKANGFGGVPAGPTVSNKPSRLKANNILASSWAILAEYSIISESTSMLQKRSPYARKW